MTSKKAPSQKASALDKTLQLLASTPIVHRRVQLKDVVPDAAQLSPVVRILKLPAPTKFFANEADTSFDKNASVPAKENTSQPLNTPQKELEMIIDDEQEEDDWLKTLAEKKKLVQKRKETVKNPIKEQSNNSPSKMSDSTKTPTSKKRSLPATKESPSKRPHLNPKDSEFFDFLGDDQDNPRAASPTSPKKSDVQTKLDRPSQQNQVTEKQGSPRKTTAKQVSLIKTTFKPGSPIKNTAKPDYPITSTAKQGSPIKSTAKQGSPIKNVAKPDSPIKDTTKPNFPKKAPPATLDDSEDFDMLDEIDVIMKNKTSKSNDVKTKTKKQSKKYKTAPLDQPGCSSDHNYPPITDNVAENPKQKRSKIKQSKTLATRYRKQIKETSDEESEDEKLPQKSGSVPNKKSNPAPKKVQKVLDVSTSLEYENINKKQTGKSQGKSSKCQVSEEISEEDKMDVNPKIQEQQLPKKPTLTKKTAPKKSPQKSSPKDSKKTKSSEEEDDDGDLSDGFWDKRNKKQSGKSQDKSSKCQVSEDKSEEDKMVVNPKIQEEQLPKKPSQTKKTAPKKSPQKSPAKDSKKTKSSKEEEEEDDGDLSDGCWDKHVSSDASKENNTEAKRGKKLVFSKKTNAAANSKTAMKNIVSKKNSAAVSHKKISATVSPKKNSVTTTSKKNIATVTSKKNNTTDDDLDEGMRRSQRSRIKPLRYWEGEREYVHNDTLGEILVDIQRPVEEQPSEKRRKPNGRVRKEPDSINTILKKLASPQDTADEDEYCELPSKIHMKLPLKPGGFLMDFEVVSEMKNMDVESKFEGTGRQDDGFRFSKTLECPLLKCGYIRINQGVNKGLQASDHVMVFSLMTPSKLQVQINGELLMVGCGQHFWVPPGVSYDVKNLSSSPALLQYTSFEHTQLTKLA